MCFNASFKACVHAVLSGALFAGHNYIGTEHILLGLLREGEGVAARVMETLGADPTKIRTAVCYCAAELHPQTWCDVAAQPHSIYAGNQNGR